MEFAGLIYYLFFALAVFAALMVVLSNHAVHQALFLVMTMVSIAALFVLINAQLAAAFQIIVYAGAIMVLFLFVIMLLNLDHLQPPSPRLKGVRFLGLLFGAGFVLQVAALLGRITHDSKAAPVTHLENAGIQPVARLLLTDYIYAFEMTSILLLIAVVGAVILANKHIGGGSTPTVRGASGKRG